MGKKDDTPGIFQTLVRLIVFVLVAGLGIWWLAGSVDRRGQVEGESISGIGKILPEPVKKVAQQTIEVVPEDARQAIEEAVRGRVLGKSEEAARTQAVKEIKSIIEKTTIQVSGFPDKQKKEVKKQVIKQVCTDLLEKVEE